MSLSLGVLSWFTWLYWHPDVSPWPRGGDCQTWISRKLQIVRSSIISCPLRRADSVGALTNKMLRSANRCRVDWWTSGRSKVLGRAGIGGVLGAMYAWHMSRWGLESWLNTTKWKWRLNLIQNGHPVCSNILSFLMISSHQRYNALIPGYQCLVGLYWYD